MTDLKDYFYNLNNYTDSEIKKFIFEFTHKLEPTLLISLNKDFLKIYYNELELKDEYSVKTAEYFGNLISEDEIERSTNVLFRSYSYSNGLYEIQEERVKFENLNYSEHREMTKKIEDFQFCMNDLIVTYNSQVFNKFPLLKTEISEDKEALDNNYNKSDFNRNYFNKIGFQLFNYLVENYEKKGKIKFINIYYFLKNDIDKNKYVFRFTQDQYTAFIKEKYNLEIKKYQTAMYGFETEKSILNSHECDFRDQ